ncbi:uncharacterized protein METZ01_LOCUS434051, partial [marine metagenome]
VEDMFEGILAFVVIGAIISGIVGLFLGSSVNRGGAGFFLGFFLGPIGWIIVFLLPRETGNSPQAQAPKERPSSQTKAAKERPPRDLASDEYKVMLGKKYEITRNELFEKFECDGKLFESLDDALKYADELEAKVEQAEIQAEKDVSVMSYEQIQADLLEKNIKVSVPLWAAGYKIIDQDGKEHQLENSPQLQEYYKKVMNK